jgi:hypothetical protein
VCALMYSLAKQNKILLPQIFIWLNFPSIFFPFYWIYRSYPAYSGFIDSDKNLIPLWGCAIKDSC